MRLIDADALEVCEVPLTNMWHITEMHKVVFKDDIDSAPTIEPKRGEWVAVTKDDLSRWECSLCGKPALLDNNEQMELSKFCPNCGAKMEVEHD